MLSASASGIWRWQPRGWAPVVAGVSDRSGSLEGIRASLPAPCLVMQAEQVHGASIVGLERAVPGDDQVPGCDGLVTRRPGLMLAIRTADCLPIFAWDAVQRVVGLAHVGWQGLVKELPIRFISFFRQMYHSAPHNLKIAIGPAIHACCYEVGPEFVPLFGDCITQRGHRRTCDLIAAARRQLARAGVPSSQVIDSGHCTACEPRWYSVRREGTGTGRLCSFILLKPSV